MPKNIAAADALMSVCGLKRVKAKRCRYCKAPFIPVKPMAIVCSWECGHALIVKQRIDKQEKEERARRKETKAKLDKLKTRRDWINEAQKAFNAYIRERDRYRPCICCGQGLNQSGVFKGGAFDAGHYRSVGSAPHLRFDDRNCHAQRKQCNRYGAGRAVDYRIGLIARIGLEAVESIESNNDPVKWTITELKAIKDLYREKLKELKESDRQKKPGAP